MKVRSATMVEACYVYGGEENGEWEKNRLKLLKHPLPDLPNSLHPPPPHSRPAKPGDKGEGCLSGVTKKLWR